MFNHLDEEEMYISRTNYERDCEDSWFFGFGCGIIVAVGVGLLLVCLA